MGVKHSQVCVKQVAPENIGQAKLAMQMAVLYAALTKRVVKTKGLTKLRNDPTEQEQLA